MDCPACGHDNRAQARFCEQCAAPLSGVEPDPRSFTPVDLAEKMRRQRPSEGERRTVTVLFVDAVESTSLAEKLGEEEMYSLMREALSRMSQAVHAYEGHVATFTGDGMMALFGAPIAHEDSARRAVAAALRMQSSLDDYGAEIEHRHGFGCRFRIGLNTGPVVVGTVTDDLRMDFTAVGDTVNLAARMEQAAEPGSVLTSEHTYRAIADFFECDAAGEKVVKGKTLPVPAWRVIREKKVRTRFEAAAERGLSPLVGRDRELEVLAEHVGRARQGTGQIVFLSGEAGIGKSRLVLELRRRSEAVGWLEGHCVSHGRTSPYLPIVDVVKSAFGVEEGDDDARIISRVDEVVSGWDKEAQKRTPYLKYLLSVDPGDPAVVTMDPQDRRVEVFEAVAALVVQESRRRALVVVMEDLHWADRLSQEALAALMTVVPSTPVVLVLTHRPTYEPPAGDCVAVELRPLGEEESQALTRGVLGVEALPPEVQRLVTAKAEGNPFYVEEVSKSLVEAGVVALANGSCRLQRPLEEIQIPGTIQDVILSRIDRLEREAKQSLQLASVIGREFTARLLGRIFDLEAQLPEVLSRLKGLELIYETARFPELSYMFKHALTHDVAYGTLLGERRRALHRLVGAAIEELYGDRLAEHFDTLAHHYFEGQSWEKALDYLEKAADKAAGAYANSDALEYYARALGICDRLGDQILPVAAALAGKRGAVNFIIGDYSGAIGDFNDLLAAAGRLGDRTLEATALGYRGLLEVVIGDWDGAEATLGTALALVEEGCEDARPIVTLSLVIFKMASNALPEAVPYLITAEEAAALPDPFLAGMWNYILGFFQYWWGRPDEALRVLRTRSDQATKLLSNRVWNWWVQGLSLATKGDYEAALHIMEEALALSERVGDTFVRPRMLNTVGWVYGELEDHERAMVPNRASVEMASVPGFPVADASMHARLNLGDNLLALGRLDEAEEQFRLVEEVSRSPKPTDQWLAWRYAQHLFHSYGELCLSRGETERALSYADRCLDLALYNSSLKNVIKGRRLRGQALLAQGLVHEAHEELAAALAVAVEVGNPPQLWKTHVALGDLWSARGEPKEARRVYGEALSVIEGVAGRLTDEQLRETFLLSAHVEGIRRAAEIRLP